MISSYQSSRETFLCLVIINQLANPLRTQLSPKLPLTVEICRNYPFMHIDVMNCVVVVYAIHFRLRIWLVDNGDATKMAAVMIQAKPTFYPVHSQISSSISADQFGLKSINWNFLRCKPHYKKLFLNWLQLWHPTYWKNGVEQLSGKLNEAQFTYEFVDCL